MSVLRVEPKELPSVQVYRGGSAPGVQCASCNETNTSGSWRRGWELLNKQNANLCNKCGQRWVKLTKALATDNLERVAAIMEPRARPSPAGGPQHRQAVPLGPVAIAFPEAKRRKEDTGSAERSFRETRVLTYAPRPRHRLRSESMSDDADLAHLIDPRLDDPSTYGGASLAPILLPSTIESSANYSKTYPAYCIQKLSDGRTTYALFWVVDGIGGSLLAALGIDSRSSGHFTYGHSPTIEGQVPSLRCTNRAEVVAWLASSLGVRRAATEAEARPPVLSADDMRRVLGGHGAVRTVPVSNDTSRYPATMVGGTRLASSPPSAGLGPLLVGLQPGYEDDVVEDEDGGPASSPSRSATKQPLDRGAKVKPTRPPQLVSPQFRCGTCGRDDHCGDDCPLGCVSPPSLIHDTTGGLPAADSLAELLIPDGLLLGSRAEDDSPMQFTAFDTFLDFSLGPGGVVGSPQEVSPGAVNGPPRRDGEQEEELHQQQIHSLYRGQSTQKCPEYVQQAQRQASTDVTMAPPNGESSAVRSTSLDWVDTLPPQGLENTLRAWFSTLTGLIADEPPSQGVGHNPAGASNRSLSSRWVPTGEALAVLHQLGNVEVSLALLERTQISRAVAMLRKHSILAVAEAAEALANRWRSRAEAALESASGARGA